MRIAYRAALAASVVLLIPAGVFAQEDAVRSVAGGGIMVQGWQGKIDANEERGGLTINSAKFEKQGDALHIVTGPAGAYWNTANKASGDYTVKATFTEPKYMNLNTHPHPYGIFIGGNDLGTADQTYLYCAAYGNGNFIVRGFGPAAFQMNGRMGGSDPAVNKAPAKGETVKQEIAISVKGDRVECSVNGKVVAGYSKAEVVGAGKLKSTDGIYGIRTAHNTEVLVTGLAKN